MSMTPTLTIAQIATTLQVSAETVRGWWAARRWPDGEPMVGLCLSERGRVRILSESFAAFCKRAAQRAGSESVIALRHSSVCPAVPTRRRRRASRSETPPPPKQSRIVYEHTVEL